MSNVDRTVQILAPSGMDLRSLDKSTGSPFVQNVMARNGEMMSREGFGLLAEFGTTLDCGRINQDQTYGLGRCIGMTSYRTFYGQDHLLSVHPVYAFSGNFHNYTGAWDTWQAGQRAVLFSGVAVHVHNLTTNRHYEFVLHQQDALSDNLSEVFPHYATRYDTNHLRWVVPAGEPQWAQFMVIDGVLILSIDKCGLWTYRSVDGPEVADRKNDSFPRFIGVPNKGETSAFSPLNLVDGPLADLDTKYVQQNLFGTPQVMTVYNGSAVYAVDNVLYFSNRNQPHIIEANNTLPVPAPDPITALGTVRGNIFVATQNQCWLYQVGNGLLSGGILTDMSNAVGCAGNQASTLSDAGLFFVGSQGVFLYSGGLDLKCISEEIDRFWTDKQSLQLPLTDYYQASGLTQLATPQPAARIDIAALTSTFRLEWSQWYRMLFLVADNITLCWTQGFGWQVWNFETHAGDAAQVKGKSNVTAPWLAVVRENIYMVCGPDVTTAIDGDGTRGLSTKDASCALLQYGRGGTTDRTADASREDLRTFNGGWVQQNINRGSSQGYLIGKPVKVPAGYVTPYGNTVAEESWWFPVSCFGIETPEVLRFRFTFDRDKWEPLFTDPLAPLDNNLDVVLPPERIESADIWKIGAGTGVNCVTLLGPKATTDTIDIAATGTTFGLIAWTTKPKLNTPTITPAPLLWLGFTAKGSFNSFSLVKSVLVATHSLIAVNCSVFVWETGDYPLERADLNSKEQGVDWVVKSTNLNADGNVFKMRGVFLRTMHLGTADSRLVSAWPYGMLNTATSTDYRDWSAQAIDFTSLPPGNSQDSIIPTARLQPTSTATELAVAKFSTGVEAPKWGDVAQPSLGNLLIGDAAVDTLATSDGSAGTFGSVMVHGTALNPGEQTRVSNVEAAIRVVGGHRRWHR